MIAIKYTTARKQLKKYCDVAVYDFETIIVTRKQDENVVIMSESEYNNLMENLYVRSDKADYERLLESIDKLKQGRNTVNSALD